MALQPYKRKIYETTILGEQSRQQKKAKQKQIEAERKAKEFNPINALIDAGVAYFSSGGNPLAAIAAAATSKTGETDLVGSGLKGFTGGTLMKGIYNPATAAGTAGTAASELGKNQILDTMGSTLGEASKIGKLGDTAAYLKSLQPGANPLDSLTEISKKYEEKEKKTQEYKQEIQKENIKADKEIQKENIKAQNKAIEIAQEAEAETKKATVKAREAAIKSWENLDPRQQNKIDKKSFINEYVSIVINGESDISTDTSIPPEEKEQNLVQKVWSFLVDKKKKKGTTIETPIVKAEVVETPKTKTTNDKYIIGKVYIDLNGKKAKYVGNGKWSKV